MAVLQVVSQFLSSDLGAGIAWNQHLEQTPFPLKHEAASRADQAKEYAGKQKEKNTEKKQQKAEGEVGEVRKQLRPS